MARNQKTQVQQPTVSDEQYKELLDIRLIAMKGFEAGTVDEQTMKAARAAVRKARKVRKAEAAILEAARQSEAQKAEARKAAAQKAAATRKANKQAAAA
jgi:hypothetical protein